ncbi:MAG: hypothetical protein WD335_01045 [Candidatus Paceibacterota bacterium]
MAEDDNKKPTSPGGVFTNDPFLNIAAAIIILMLVGGLIEQLPTMWADISAAIEGRIGSLGGLYTTTYVVAVGFSAACLSGAIYAGLQKSSIAVAERKELKAVTRAAISGEDTHNDRWQHILSYAASDDHELWRLAIIEADVMLNEMLKVMGYQQDSLGEKLKNAEESDFRTLNQAWEAHKLRNTIAHEGSTYNLTRGEVDRAIDNYRQVFNEFSYI